MYIFYTQKNIFGVIYYIQAKGGYILKNDGVTNLYQSILTFQFSLV